MLSVICHQQKLPGAMDIRRRLLIANNVPGSLFDALLVTGTVLSLAFVRNRNAVKNSKNRQLGTWLLQIRIAQRRFQENRP